MRAAPALGNLRASFERLAHVDADRSQLCASICRAVAGDDEILALLSCAPPHQRRPTLLLAAIHNLLLAGVEHELAAHVPTVAAGRAPTGDAGELALGFCRQHRDELERLLATRSTQTNEVNRAAALAPALVHATPPGAALQLVELGASAGLNLLADRFAYRYRPGVVGVSVPWGAETPTTPSVVCDCAVDGDLHPVIWHSWALAYATPARQRALGRTIDALAARRDLTWIYLEPPGETPGLPTPLVARVRHDRADSALVAVSYRGGRRTVERLADAHPHVHRMRWLAQPR